MKIRASVRKICEKCRLIRRRGRIINMTKPIPRIGSRRNSRISSRKSGCRTPIGVIHVQASFNNTIVTVTDPQGRVVSWSSAGTCGFKGTRRGTPFAAQTAAGNAIRAVVDQGMQRAEVMIKGPGLGRDAALRAIRRSGILLNFVRDVTPMPHNGCRPPKKGAFRNKNGKDSNPREINN
ncbi:30S ribosomal protein S11 [Nymphaea thermarum]|nr:30S ribosomal protein S11 [Nymphaea thermarum]